MRVTKLAAVAVIVGSIAAAHSQPLSEGDLIAGAGLGFGTYGGLSLGGSFEKGFIDDIADNLNLSLGGFASFTSYDYNSNYSVTRTFVGGQANLNYYEASFNKLQPYVGITLGYDLVSTSYTGNLGGGITGGAQVGTRFYLSDSMAANVRLGWPISIIGLDFRF